IFALFFTNAALTAQNAPFKFGKVSTEEMKMDKCEFYPDAKSMIIANYGNLTFDYNDRTGWQYSLVVEVRKKIFEITDADEGTIKLRIYEPVDGKRKEEIVTIKAYVHNLVDGKIEREKVKAKESFTTRLNDYWLEVSFPIPNVKAGTVLEYQYRKRSDFTTNLETWAFQSDVPTAHSEFRFTIPEFFNYQIASLGNVYNLDQSSKYIKEQFTYSWMSTPQAGEFQKKKTGTLNSNSTWRRFVAKNVMPLEDEPYMNNKSDIPSRLEFQLVSIQYPGQTIETVAGSYEKFNNEMLSHSALGDRLDKGNFIKSLQDNISDKNQIEKAQIVYDHIRKHFSWNGVKTFLSSDAGKPAYKEAKGDVADINLSLIAALREVGVQADPILLSTRGHGTIHPVYPSYDEFDYVIALVTIDDASFFLDAATGMPFGQLPLRCRNGKGWRVSPRGGWVDMKANSSYSSTTYSTITLNDSQIKAHITNRLKDYAAIDEIKEIKEESEEKYKNAIASQFESGNVNNITISEADYSKPLSVEFDLVKEMDGEDIIYIEPILIGTIKENIFQREERMSPIDFPYEQHYNVVTQIEIPEGYTAELPEPALIKLPQQGGSFTFNVSQSGNMISVVSDLKIDQTMFSQKDYPALKQFYQMVADKNQEVIILKK
ncbi:MAG: DUF3858 domain-containing protein, partial [Fulvivirga sp.]|nr:DUF3858 domain-containing protein [Fulvivirga sp.]